MVKGPKDMMKKERLRALGLLYHRKRRLSGSYPCGRLKIEIKPSQRHPVKGQEAQGTSGNVGNAT